MNDLIRSSQRAALPNLLGRSIFDDLFGALLQVEKAGGKICGKPEEYDYGRFGWFLDPEGNKIELWQPL